VGKEFVWVGRKGNELSVFDVGLCALQKKSTAVVDVGWGGAVNFCEVKFIPCPRLLSPIPPLQVPGRCSCGVLPSTKPVKRANPVMS
jgi:hypothetical protein